MKITMCEHIDISQLNIETSKDIFMIITMNENYIVEDISNVANRAWFSIKDFEFDIDSNCRTALTKKFLEKKTNIPSIVELKEMFRTDFNQMHTALFIRKIFITRKSNVGTVIIEH